MVGLIWDLHAIDRASGTNLKVAGTFNKLAGASQRSTSTLLEADRAANRLRIAELQVAAATERHAAASTSASASISRQATAEIGLIRANENLATAQAASSAAAVKASRSHKIAERAAATSTAATKKLTLPLLALGGIAIHEAMQYEKGLTTIQIAAGRTNKEMAQSTKGLLQISRETATGTDELTESYYVASKAGLSVAKSLDVTRAAAQGAKAEGADLGTVTNALTSIMASYGSKLRDPVAAMNMLVRGAGLAKTTTETYAGSLSTVIPLAAAAGIGFDQVGGALATLTQHGTSADQATQELAFGIRNLQAPNNVAIAAMNQMGISAVDISKNLGKRGLTGTFDYIGSKLPKTALVYVGAMKKMEAGTSDLTIMQSKMPPALKLASREFLNGSLSMREYRKTYRDMGAEGNAQGRAFLTLSQKVRGYSDAVKSGTPAQKTAVSLLKQMLGGASGLNNYLQLSGESAHYFAASTARVGEAAKHAGKDVLGFDEAKHTASFKQQQLIANIKADVIEFGTAALPVFKSIVDRLTSAVQWFDHLSSGTKKFIGYGLLIAAAFGPALKLILALGRGVLVLTRLQAGMRGFTRGSDAMGSAAYRNGERVSRAFGSQATAAQRAATETAAAQTRITGAVQRGAAAQSRAVVAGSRAQQRAAREAQREQRTTATPAGAGTPAAGGSRLASLGAGAGLVAGVAGPLVGTAIANGSKPGSAASVIGNSITYAGIGAMMGSFFPGFGTAIGAALGAAIGAAQGGGGQGLFGKPTVGFSINMPKIGTVGQDYKKSILTTGQDQRGSAPKMSYVSGLLQAGAGKKIADDFERVGMTSKDLTIALTGTDKQYRQIVGRYRTLGPSSLLYAASIETERRALERQNKAAHDQALASGITLASMQKQGTLADVLKGKFGNFNQEGLTATQVQTRFGTATDSVRAAIAANGKTLDRSTTAGRQNALAFQQASAVSLQHAQAVYRTTGSAKAAAAALATDRDALVKLGTQLGLSKTDIGNVTNALFNIPANRKSTVSINTEAAINDLHTVRSTFDTIISQMTGRSVTIPIYTKVISTGKGNAGVAVTPGGGTVITGGGDANKKKGHTPANGMILTGFANGGINKPGRESHIAQIARAGDWRVWAEDETGGEAYIPLAHSKRARSRAIAMETVHRLGGVAMFAKGGVVGQVHKQGKGWIYDGKYYVTKSGAEKAAAQAAYDARHVAAAAGVYRVGKGYGYQGSYYDHSKDANQARRDDLHQAAAAAKYISPQSRGQARTSLTGYQSAIASGDVSSTQTAYQSLYQDAKAAGASKAALDKLAKSETSIITKLKARQTATDQAAKATDHYNDLTQKAADLRSSVRGAFTGTFDITQSAPQMFNDVAGGGSASAILASLTAKANKAAAFSALLTKLGKAGLNRTLLQQLAEAGPTAEAFNAANALAVATPKQISAIGAQYRRLDVSGYNAGATLATTVFGSQIDVAKALLNGYSTKNPAIAGAVSTLATQLFGAGKVSGVGLANGLLGQKKAAGTAATTLGNTVRDSLKKSLKIHSPSRVTRELGMHTGVGFALGLMDSVSHVAGASDLVGAAGVPSPTSGSGTARGGDYYDQRTYKFEVNEAEGGMDTVNKLMRRMALSGP